jgi:heat shock protein HslJ
MKRSLVVCLLVLFLSSCKVLQSDTDSPQLGGTKWILQSIQKRPVNLKENAFLNFDEKENRIAGKAACNSFPASTL